MGQHAVTEMFMSELIDFLLVIVHVCARGRRKKDCLCANFPVAICGTATKNSSGLKRAIFIGCNKRQNILERISM